MLEGIRRDGFIAGQQLHVDITHQRSTFQHPFIRLAGQEVAFYPTVNAKDISRVHLFPTNLKVQQPSDL